MDDLPPSSEAAAPSAHAPSHGHAAHDDHGHDHHELPWIRKYVFSTDHKTIGIQYIVAGLILMFFGFMLMLLMRWQLAFPGQALTYTNVHHHVGYQFHQILYHLGIDSKAPVDPLPVPPNPNHICFMERLFGHDQMPGGVMTGDFYNTLGAMHGTIMVFFAIVPIGFAAFGNFVMPLQIGAVDMAFPRLNMGSVILFFISAVLMCGSFFVPGGAAKSGWTSYTPLATISDQPQNTVFWGHDFHYMWPMWLTGQSVWIIAMAFNITSSLLSSVNFITTIVQLRVKGLGWMRLPFFVWTQFVTAFLLLLAFPPLEAAALMQLEDRLAGSSLFSPGGLVIGGTPLINGGGGTPLLWQHLFWFLGHPEVYVLILPGLGIIAEVIANNARKPIWGYNQMVYGLLVLGFLSMIVWAHHMYLTGMGTAVSSFFQLTTIIISVPTIILLSSLIISLWGGSIRFTSPMLWATAFLPLFGIGGLTGIPLAFNAPDTFLHDTYYIIAHFHYVIAPGHDLRLLHRRPLLVPEGDGPDHERVLEQGPFLADDDPDELHLLPDVPAGHGRHASPHVRRRRDLRGAEQECAPLERLHLRGGVAHGTGADSVHHQLLLQLEVRPQGLRQSMGSDHNRVVRAFAASARQLHPSHHRVSRTVRIQRARCADRLHAAGRAAGQR